MKYRLPRYEDKEILKEYVEEHYSNYERSIVASAEMTNMEFTKWVEKVNGNSENGDDNWGMYYQYLAFDDNEKLVGMLSIRFDLPIELREKYGDIGYGVRPSERKKGYASEMLKYALNVCKEKNMDEVIVACYDQNYTSKKIIEKNGGTFYRSIYDDRKINDEWPLKLKFNFYKIRL